MKPESIAKCDPVCRACGGGAPVDLGAISPTNRFAGRSLPHVLEGGRLWRCPSCHLVFRSPVLSKSELDALYTEGSGDAWSGSGRQRRDWVIAKRWLDKALPTGATLLDVGCFDGGFLEFMGSRYRRFGVEINALAIEKARSKGIEIVGDDLDVLTGEMPSFDCVTAFDVIEHVENPAQFVTTLAKHVSPGGLILIATGNADAPTFRFMGPAYWYCTVAEHLSFVSPQWFAGYVRRNKLQVVNQSRYSHARRSYDPRPYLSDLTKNLLYRASPGAFAWLRRQGLGGDFARSDPKLEAHPPTWTTATDHFITLLTNMS